MVDITLPDGSKRLYPIAITGEDLAKDISRSLARKAVAVKVNGKLADLTAPIEQDARAEVISRDDDAALEIIRHDAAHLLAQAVQQLYPDTQVTIGPVIEDGFYYDFAREEPFSTDDLAEIEKTMA